MHGTDSGTRRYLGIRLYAGIYPSERIFQYGAGYIDELLRGGAPRPRRGRPHAANIYFRMNFRDAIQCNANYPPRFRQITGN